MCMTQTVAPDAVSVLFQSQDTFSALLQATLCPLPGPSSSLTLLLTVSVKPQDDSPLPRNKHHLLLS